MRAIVCKTLGGSAELVEEQISSPVIGAGSVRVAVHACGINFADSLIVAGRYQTRPDLPFIPGFEISGRVLEVAPHVHDVDVGDRVMGILPWGGFADEAVLPRANVFRIPDRMDYVTAAAFPIAYGTSHGALDWRGRLRAGEVLLVHGAAGGVGLTAVEIGKAMGATVIACAGSDAKLAIAQRHGADHLIDYTKENLKERVLALTDGRGADVIYDPVGGDVFDASLRCIAPEGRIVVVGFASGRVPQAPANILLVKNCDVIGFYWGHYRLHRQEAVRRTFETLFGWFETGRLKPHVSQVLDLSQAGRAIDTLSQRQSTGKVVLVTGRE